MKTEPLPPIQGTTLEHSHLYPICDKPPALFSLGNLVATPAALAVIQGHDASIQQLLNRHQTGDWQELCEEDRDNNWRAVFSGERVLSTFNIRCEGKSIKIWIITEWDRSYTTVLTPECY